MNLLKKILVAVDFDTAADAVIGVVGTLVKRFGSEVVLAHVVEDTDESAPISETLRESILARLGQVQQPLTASGVNVSQVLCPRGRPAAKIVEIAEQIGANLIVLGTRGTEREDHFPLGTTTEAVIRRTPRPVLAVPRKPPLTFAGIVCPVDFSEVSARGLANAIHVARLSRGKLQVLTVVSPARQYHGLGPLWAERAAAAEEAATTQGARDLDEFLKSFDFQGVTWEKHVLRGDPAHEIVQRAKSTGADLIVMGSSGRAGLPYMLMGSTAVKVARLLPCALLTVKRAQVLVADVTQKIDDLNAAFEEGQALLAQGFYQEAMTRFDQCLDMDAHCADAADARAEALERLGRREQADDCRKRAEAMRQKLRDQRVTAEIRAQHSFFHRRKPYP